MVESRVVDVAWIRGLDWPRACGSLSMALGLTVLVGWVLGIESLTRVLPGLITMKPNAALGFLLGGLALWLIREGRPVSGWAIRFSSAVAVLGVLTLFEYFSGIKLGIDEVLAREPAAHFGSLAPGRMHPSTAFNFLILGIALALMASDRNHRVSHGLALLAALIAGSTLIGYLFGVREFVGLAAYHQMALHTTIGMMALCVGTLLARPRQGLMVAITADGPSGMMARSLIPVAILTPIIINALMIIARQTGMFDELYATAVRVTLVIAIFVGCIGRSAHLLYNVDLERRRAETERAEGQHRFRFLAESMPQIVWLARANGEVEYLNRRWRDYTGQEPQGGWDWKPVLHPDDLTPCLEAWESSTRSGTSHVGEYRLRRHDGVFRWHLYRAEPMRDESGRIVHWVGTSTDIDDQRRAGEQRFRSLVEATTSIVWNASASGRAEGEEPGWQEFTGQSFEEIQGWGWLDAIHPDDRIPTILAWQKAIASRSLYEVKHRLRRHDGEYRHMQARGVPLLNQDGAIAEWIGVHTDIDDQERAHQAMREAKEAAEAATRAKGEFLANMSHEIRTPMNGVLGMTELALATELSPIQREYIELVRSSAESLLTIINDILDFSKIEAGKLELDPVPFSPREIVTDTLRSMALKAKEKGLELSCRIGPEVPVMVVGDPGRLRQVLLNLVGNAIKFTDIGQVAVTVEADLVEADPEAFRFSVFDSGIGIPAEKRASIFNAFEQADGSTTRKYGGTGLGLTISARLVELMQGRIWVEENPEGGSIFRFTVRLGRDVQAWTGQEVAVPVTLQGLRVLIVDDNRTNRVVLDEILSQWGCRPLAVTGGHDALDALDRAAGRGQPFPLVLIDQKMPRMDGSELAIRIRADPRYHATRMLMISSGGFEASSRSRELGIGVWLSRPFQPSELHDAMVDLLQPEPVPLASEPVAPAPAPPLPLIEKRSRLRVLLAEDHPINQKVATRMLEDQGHEVTVVGDGKLVLQALESSTFDLILMDMQMPEMGGFETLEVIRSADRSRGGHLPVIALTAHAMVGDRERCLAAGFDDYVSKPVQAAALAEALARIEVVRQGLPDPAPEDLRSYQVFDRSTALKGLDGDERLLDEILGLFLDEGPRFLAEAREAIEGQDVGTLIRVGHTLAGTASHFAAEGLVVSARRLEAMGKAGDLEGARRAVWGFAQEFDRFGKAATETPRPGPEDPGS